SLLAPLVAANKALRAPATSVAPVPPCATATVPVTLPAVVAVDALTAVVAVDALPAMSPFAVPFHDIVPAVDRLPFCSSVRAFDRAPDVPLPTTRTGSLPVQPVGVPETTFHLPRTSEP